MKSASFSFAAPAALLGALVVAPASAQYQPPYQPQYQPAPMQAPASQASVVNLDNRIGMLERQITQLVRQNEEATNRVTVLEAELTRLREQERRLIALEEKIAGGSVAAPAVAAAEIPAKPAETAAANIRPASIPTTEGAETDPAEIAYDEGYQLWRSKKYDQAITALRSFSSAFPKHRRASWANNLAGRAMLDKGEPRAAAEALLANYRGNPKGERAADSLYYLGQALMKLGQPNQACKAYAELEAVYGTGIRGELKTLLPKAKAEANCG